MSCIVGNGVSVTPPSFTLFTRLHRLYVLPRLRQHAIKARGHGPVCQYACAVVFYEHRQSTDVVPVLVSYEHSVQPVRRQSPPGPEKPLSLRSEIPSSISILAPPSEARAQLPVEPLANTVIRISRRRRSCRAFQARPGHSQGLYRRLARAACPQSSRNHVRYSGCPPPRLRPLPQVPL